MSEIVNRTVKNVQYEYQKRVPKEIVYNEIIHKKKVYHAPPPCKCCSRYKAVVKKSEYSKEQNEIPVVYEFISREQIGKLVQNSIDIERRFSANTVQKLENGELVIVKKERMKHCPHCERRRKECKHCAGAYHLKIQENVSSNINEKKIETYHQSIDTHHHQHDYEENQYEIISHRIYPLIRDNQKEYKFVQKTTTIG